MGDREHHFWTSDHKYEDLARAFERNIEIIQPERVTSRRMCPCLEYSPWCGHPLEGNVEYYEHRGESVK